jgi:formylglycine-generating enzyme required for sulfatase activity
MSSLLKLSVPVCFLYLLAEFIFPNTAYSKYKGWGAIGKQKEDTSVKKKKREAKLADVAWDRETQGQLRIFCNPKARLFVDGEIQRDPRGKIRASEKFVVALKAGKRKIRMDAEGLKLVTCFFIDHEKKKHTLSGDASGEVTVEIIAGEAHSINFTLARAQQVKSTMVFVLAGEFVMGLSAEPGKKGGKSDLEYIVERIGGKKSFHKNEVPRHKVDVKAFHLDTYEVTNNQYQKFIQETRRPVPDDWEDNSYPPGKDNHPVIFVTWDDADAYCKWAGKRLPTEEEWEKAARWETNRKKPIAYFFPWGDSFRRGKANTASGGPKKVMPVGSYEDGKSPYGAYDMCGNVKEWTASWYKDYPGNQFKDAFSDGTKVKVARGGSWRNKKYDVLGSCRFKYSLTHADDDLGFRCAKDPEEKK